MNEPKTTESRAQVGNVTELISSVLRVIACQFYADDVRAFKRDEHALRMAIARYGYECANRGWFFDAAFIERQLLDLLRDIKSRSADVRYLPKYLEGAVDRSIRMKADELVEQAKKRARAAHQVGGISVVSLANKQASAVCGELMKKVKPAVVIKPSDAEICRAVYEDLKKQQQSKRAAKKKVAVKKAAAVQEDLFQ